MEAASTLTGFLNTNNQAIVCAVSLQRVHFFLRKAVLLTSLING
jgi:hypothetical protein